MDLLTADEFGLLALAALRSLPEETRATLDRYNVALIVGDRSPVEVRKWWLCRAVYGTYEGPPVSESPRLAGRRITLYRVDVCTGARDRDHLVEWLPQIIDHEYRHFLGLDHAAMGFSEPSGRVKLNPVYAPPAGFVIRNREIFDQGQHAEVQVRATQVHHRPQPCGRCGAVAERRTVGTVDQSESVGHVDACVECEPDSWKFVTRGPAADKLRRLRGKQVI